MKSGESQDRPVGTAGPEMAIAVSDVARAQAPLPESSRIVAIENLLRKPPWPEGLREAVEQHARTGDKDAASLLRQESEMPASGIEACSRYHGSLVAAVNYHPVMAAAHLAFQDHRPLVFSPDIVWLMIAQGFANHVRANAISLRRRLVCHEGQLSLTVRRDDFVKGSPENPWPEVFAAFECQIQEHLGPEAFGLIRPDFSTTGPVERAAGSIVLMQGLQSYFSFDFMTLCGIPEVVLEGLPADWESLAARTESLNRFDLDWWTRVLQPILDEFVKASRGRPDREFWRGLYKLDDESGGPYATGWLAAFFPYLWDFESGMANRRNSWFQLGAPELQTLLHPNLTTQSDLIMAGLKTDDMPSGLSMAPFNWQYLDKRFEMEFLGGFTGVLQSPGSLRLKPEIGWAIREAAPRDGQDAGKSISASP